MNKHLSFILGLMALMLTCVSCNDFLEEHPKTFLSPDNYYTSQSQAQAAVNGLYTFLDDIFNGDIEVGTQRFIFIEYLSGYGIRPRAATTQDFNQVMTHTIKEENTAVEALWRTAYSAMENCNSVIFGIENATAVMADDVRNQLLGEAYFMRAYFYFNLVRLWGEVPLKITPTTDLKDVQLPLASQEEVYAQIVSDLETAETCMTNLAWIRGDGHVGKGAVKTLLAKVYLTMAGYPLQKGSEYFTKAYQKAVEVSQSGAFSLFGSYADLRNPSNANAGEFILSIQREADNAGSPVHNDMLPYPAPDKEISSNSAYGGALAPEYSFYTSYPTDDKRTEEQGYYYTEHMALDGSEMVQLGAPYIYKYWDSNAAASGKSGMNYPLLRYADVLLMLAEAKVQADGGSTTDAAAINAYYAVRNRALPDEGKPTSINFDMVYRERLWELCFENQTYYDMLRTRKAMHCVTGSVVDLIGFQAPGHNAAFKEADLLLPYPQREKRLNPNLVR